MNHKTSYNLTKNIITTIETLNINTNNKNIINTGYSQTNKIHYTIIIDPLHQTIPNNETINTLNQNLQQELINHPKQTLKESLDNATKQTPQYQTLPLLNLAITRINEKSRTIETATQGTCTAIIKYNTKPSIKIQNTNPTQPKLITYKNTLKNLQYIFLCTENYTTHTKTKNITTTELAEQTINGQGTQLLQELKQTNQNTSYATILTK